MKIIQGDLIKLAKEGKFDVIMHGCNCFHTMEAGIAKQIKHEFPGAYEADLNSIKGDWSKLGWYSSWKDSDSNLTVINVYTQYEPGARFEYLALYTFMYGFPYFSAKEFEIKSEDLSKIKVGLPKIGCGIGGGDFNIVKQIIEKYLDRHMDVTIVEYQK